MTELRIYTITNLLHTASKAYHEKDVDKIEKLISINNDWLQDESDRNAINSVLECLSEAIEMEEY